MTGKDFEDAAGKLIWEAASLRPGAPGHAGKTAVIVNKMRKLVRQAQEQAREDDLTIMTGGTEFGKSRRKGKLRPMNDWSTPEAASRNGWRWFWIAGMSLIAMAGIVILIGWQVAGWFGQANANRGYSQTVHGQGYQTAVTAQMQQHLKNIGDLAVTRAGLPAKSPQQQSIRAQQLNELAPFCSEALQLTAQNPAAIALQQKAAANCDAGVPVPNPPLASPIPAG